MSNLISCHYWSILVMHFYRPHPEGMGKVMFSPVSVCLLTLGGEGQVPHPRSGQGGIPIPDQDGGTTYLLTGGYPHPRSGWGYPSSRSAPPPDKQDGVIPHPGGQVPPPPPDKQDGVLLHPGPRSGGGGYPDQNSIRGGAVSLWRSRRRTLLFFC